MIYVKSTVAGLVLVCVASLLVGEVMSTYLSVVYHVGTGTIGWNSGFLSNPFDWFFTAALFPPGVPWPLYILLTPVEFVSTFIVRPISLTLRLLMNLVAGHMLLALCWAATQFFLVTLLFTQGNGLGLLGLGTFAFGVVFFALELFVALLQAYVITILGAIYIQLSLADEH